MEPFSVGPWTVEPSRHVLAARDRTVRLEPRLMVLLVTLAERRAEVVTRDELIERAWDFPPADEALTQAMSALRRILGDDARAPRFIETIPKRGYRLLPAVAPRDLRVSSKRRPLWALFATATLAVATFTYLFARTDSRSDAAPQFLTSAPGRESQPAVSRDGTRVAYVASDERGWSDLYVGDRTGRSTRLTSDAAYEGSPAWSADGTKLAFVRTEGGRCTIIILALAGNAHASFAPCSSAAAQLAWSPDGSSMVIADRDSNGTNFLQLRRLHGGAARRLTSPRDIDGDRFPAFSPDGQAIAFIRTTAMGGSDLYIVDLAEGEPRRITREGHWMAGLTWTADDRLIVSSNRDGVFSLWELSVKHPERWQRAGGQDGVRPSSGAQVIAYERQRFDSDIYAAPVDRGAKPARMMPSTRDDYEPSVSPDGASIAFLSARSGRPQVWVATRGDPPRQLTSMRATALMTPRWSRDGKRLAFAALTGGEKDIYIANVSTAAVERMSGAGAIELSPSFGRSSLYFTSNRGGRWRGWKRSLDSGEEEVSLDLPVGTVRELDDGSLLFNRMDRPGLWRQRTSGPASLLTDRLAAAAWGEWDIAIGRVFFVDRTGAEPVLASLDLQTGERRALRPLRVDSDWQGLSITPDGATVYFSIRDAGESDIAILATPAATRRLWSPLQSLFARLR